MSKSDEARDALADVLRDTARWRREKAEQFPEDGRSLSAAEQLEAIAGTVGQVPAELMDRYAAAWDFANGIRISELQSELIRKVGFGLTINSASQFIAILIRDLEIADPRAAIGMGEA
jgi:hypothetical protein